MTRDELIKNKANLRDVKLRDANLRGANLRGANLSGANLRGANLREADLRDAYLRDADLRGADLRGADLSDAYLRGANLRDADLRGADLCGADLRDAMGYIVGPQRADRYRFDLRWLDGKWRVVAGCNTSQNWTIPQYREHAAAYDDERKTADTLAILDYLEALAKRTPTGETGQ